MSKIQRVSLCILVVIVVIYFADYLIYTNTAPVQLIETEVSKSRPNAKRDLVINHGLYEWKSNAIGLVAVYNLSIYNQSKIHSYDKIKVKLGYINQYNTELSSVEKVLYRTIPPGGTVEVKDLKAGSVTLNDKERIDGGTAEVVD